MPKKEGKVSGSPTFVHLWEAGASICGQIRQHINNLGSFTTHIQYQIRLHTWSIGQLGIPNSLVNRHICTYVWVPYYLPLVVKHFFVIVGPRHHLVICNLLAPMANIGLFRLSFNTAIFCIRLFKILLPWVAYSTQLGCWLYGEDEFFSPYDVIDFYANSHCNEDNDWVWEYYYDKDTFQVTHATIANVVSIAINLDHSR